jgi:hypothetical protein
MHKREGREGYKNERGHVTMAIREKPILRRKRRALVSGEIKGGMQMHVHMCFFIKMENEKLRSCLTRVLRRKNPLFQILVLKLDNKGFSVRSDPYTHIQQI